MRELKILTLASLAAVAGFEVVLVVSPTNIALTVLGVAICALFVGKILSALYLWRLYHDLPQRSQAWLIAFMARAAIMGVIGLSLIMVAGFLPLISEVHFGAKMFSILLGSGIVIIASQFVLLAILFWFIERRGQGE